MKLRCTHNSVRLRVRKSDLDTLKENGSVEESVQFGPGNTFRFALKTDVEATGIYAIFEGQNIVLGIPQKDVDSWIQSNKVGLETNHSLENGETLHLLIEKDFPCVDRENENKADTFWELVPDAPDAC